jgi:hypothetical protein
MRTNEKKRRNIRKQPTARNEKRNSRGKAYIYIQTYIHTHVMMRGKHEGKKKIGTRQLRFHLQHAITFSHLGVGGRGRIHIFGLNHKINIHKHTQNN